MLHEQLKEQAIKPGAVRMPGDRVFYSPARDLTVFMPRVVDLTYDAWYKCPPPGVTTQEVEKLGEALSRFFSAESLEGCRTEEEAHAYSRLHELPPHVWAMFFSEIGFTVCIAAWYGQKVHMPIDGTREQRLGSITQIDPDAYVEYFAKRIEAMKNRNWLSRLLRRFVSWLG